MLIPIRTDYRMTRVPWVNYLLITANVALFVLGINGQTAYVNPQVSQLMLHPDEPELFQFITATFLHAGWLHLLGNMVFLWVFGNAVNDRFGQAGYLAFYLAGGVLSGIGYVLLGGQAPVLGASGAISAVTGAYLVMLPRVRVTLLVWLYIVTYFEVSSVYFLLVQFVFNLYMSLAPSLPGLASGGVAYAAHSSGYLFGILLVAGLLAVRAVPRDAFDLLSLLRASHRRQHFRRMVAKGYDPFSFQRPAGAREEAPSRWVQTKTVTTATPDTAAAREMELRRAISEACGRTDLPAAASCYLQLVQIAEDAVLPLQQQLDVANQLMAGENYPAAADAYERFLRHYSSYENAADIYLMLGLLYGRYLQQYDRAEHYLQLAIGRLEDRRKTELAETELQAVRRRKRT